ncbi:MAG: hypothetical protein V2A77_05935 [Pseudomonadota bacterium]
MRSSEFDQLLGALEAPEEEARRQAARRILDVFSLDDSFEHIQLLMAGLPRLLAALEADLDPQLLSLALDAMEAAPEPLALKAVLAALKKGGELAEAVVRSPRRFGRRGAAQKIMACLRGPSEAGATSVLSAYPHAGRFLTCAQAVAAGALPRHGGLEWLERQRRAWTANRGRPVPEDLLALVLARKKQARPTAPVHHLAHFPANIRLVQVPGLPEDRLRLTSGLLGRSAREAGAAYRLAAAFSAAAGMPVVTLHNATLGGFSGWGVPGFEIQAGGSGLAREARKLGAAAGPDSGLLEDLVRRRFEVLVRPGLHWLLSGLRQSCLLTGDEAGYAGWLKKAARWLGEAPDLPRFAFPFRCREDLEGRLAASLATAEAEEQRLSGQMEMLAALWLAGRHLMAQGRLKSLVIPVVDKFVASSSRGREVSYLAAFARCLLSVAPEARLLLFDASPNPDSPSLRFTPSLLEDAGVAARGLGIFSPDGSLPQNMHQMLRCSGGKNLFLLEPEPCRGRRGAERLGAGDGSLLAPQGYDPAWKEAVGWLTAGTPLADLAPCWLPPPPHEGRVLTSAGPLPGGVFYRLMLRRRLGLMPRNGRAAEAALWRRWARFARLDPR